MDERMKNTYKTLDGNFERKEKCGNLCILVDGNTTLKLVSQKWTGRMSTEYK
jgi:hypothetical protein